VVHLLDRDRRVQQVRQLTQRQTSTHPTEDTQ
jgi:hypothetical protein